MIDEKKLANAAMNEEELDNVSGGSSGELANDSRFLNVLTNGKCDRYGEYKAYRYRASIEKEITAAWATVGIKADVTGNICFSNKYKRIDNGQELTQEQARQYAMDFVGRQLKESDWKW